jgi:hypothetical protein
MPVEYAADMQAVLEVMLAAQLAVTAAGQLADILEDRLAVIAAEELAADSAAGVAEELAAGLAVGADTVEAVVVATAVADIDNHSACIHPRCSELSDKRPGCPSSRAFSLAWKVRKRTAGSSTPFCPNQDCRVGCRRLRSNALGNILAGERS